MKAAENHLNSKAKNQQPMEATLVLGLAGLEFNLYPGVMSFQPDPWTLSLLALRNASSWSWNLQVIKTLDGKPYPDCIPQWLICFCFYCCFSSCCIRGRCCCFQYICVWSSFYCQFFFVVVLLLFFFPECLAIFSLLHLPKTALLMLLKKGCISIYFQLGFSPTFYAW